MAGRVRDRCRRRRLDGAPGARVTGATRTGTWRWPSAATRRRLPGPAGAAHRHLGGGAGRRTPGRSRSATGGRNVGYGEVLRGAAAQPGAPAGPAGRAAARRRPGRRRPTLRAHHLPLSTRRPPPGPGRRAAGRRRAVADQPVHRRGHLLRGAAPARWPGAAAAVARTTRGAAAYAGRAAPPTGPATCGTARRRPGWPARRRWSTRPSGPPARDHRVFDVDGRAGARRRTATASYAGTIGQRVDRVGRIELARHCPWRMGRYAAGDESAGPYLLGATSDG